VLRRRLTAAQAVLDNNEHEIAALRGEIAELERTIADLNAALAISADAATANAENIDILNEAVALLRDGGGDGPPRRHSSAAGLAATVVALEGRNRRAHALVEPLSAAAVRDARATPTTTADTDADTTDDIVPAHDPAATRRAEDGRQAAVGVVKDDPVELACELQAVRAKLAAALDELGRVGGGSEPAASDTRGGAIAGAGTGIEAAMGPEAFREKLRQVIAAARKVMHDALKDERAATDAIIRRVRQSVEHAIRTERGETTVLVGKVHQRITETLAHERAETTVLVEKVQQQITAALARERGQTSAVMGSPAVATAAGRCEQRDQLIRRRQQIVDEQQSLLRQRPTVLSSGASTEALDNQVRASVCLFVHLFVRSFVCSFICLFLYFSSLCLCAILQHYSVKRTGTACGCQ
jgi:hypothetical protein